MSGVVQSLVEESLELSNMFRQNAALKNGLPECRRVSVPKIDPTPPPAPPVVNVDVQPTPVVVQQVEAKSPSPGAPAAETAKPSWLSRSAPWLLAGVTGLGGSLATSWMSKDTPDAPAPAAVQQQKEQGWLLQWLQENGKHRPEGQWEIK